jgi:hypothetical protein
MKAAVFCAAVAFVAALPLSAQAQGYKKELPDSLVAKAKITEDSAAKVAMKRVPKGNIESVALEREKGKLQYSYDIKVPGKTGVQEVLVSALTGKVMAVMHETPAMQKKEAAAEKKPAAPMAPKPKKP